VHNESSRQKSLLLREILIGAYPCSWNWRKKL
jgi:hypothetical protein